jgi:hypothetical protein
MDFRRQIPPKLEAENTKCVARFNQQQHDQTQAEYLIEFGDLEFVILLCALSLLCETLAQGNGFISLQSRSNTCG